MSTLKALTIRPLLLMIGFAIAGAATASQSSDTTDSRVQVTWTNPADFTEAKQSYCSGIGRESPDEWLRELAKHVSYRAERVLPPVETLQVTLTNVQPAGTYEPWGAPRWDDVRIIKDIYPPRIDLTYTLTNASGAVVKEGKRELRDPAFL